MVYISGLKFRGFKSFRRAEASFPKGYVCLAGPNGSGKSNITDGIRFALGEASLKALRAKRVSELINTSSKYAEVTLFIDGERQYEIKRAINSEGKTLYRLNGKRSTRTLVMEELRQYGLEAGSHNIIAQGQVQKIVEMSAKERRQIIDSVAGILEFDEKKEEALRELAKVEQKITEASIVLGEREAMLNDLEKEKNAALAYLEAQESFKRAMASIVTAEHSRLSKAFAEAVRKKAELDASREESAKQLAVLNARLSELESQRAAVVQKIGSSGSREAQLREIEELKVKIGSGTATANERKKEEKRLAAEEKALESQLEKLKNSRKECSLVIESLSRDIARLSKQISELEKSGGLKGGAEELGKKLELASEKIVSLKERKAALESNVRSAEKMLAMRREERERLSSTVGEAKGEKLSGELENLKKEVQAHESALESLFERERSINRTLPDMDRQLLSLKEKAATLRATLSPAATSLALRLVEELKSQGMKGIYGTVSSLISCDPKYNTAIEAAAGARLNYVVVDRMDTAVKVIEKLKEQKSGRCTFIPLDTVKPPEAASGSAAGCLGPLINFVEFDAACKPAMGYVFSDTLLFDSVENARKAGIGKARMVSLEGELIEKSGIIAGGSQKGTLLSKSGLDKVEAEAEALKKERETLYAQLYSIRDEMAARRKEKAAAEVKLKGIEIEMEAASARLAAAKKTLEEIRKIDLAIAAAEKELAAMKKEEELLSQQLQQSLAEHEALKAREAAEEEKLRQADAESAKRLQQLHSQRSSLEAQLSAKREQLSAIDSEAAELQGKLKEISVSLQGCRKEIESLEAEVKADLAMQREKEAKLAEMSTASQKLVSRLNELDSQVKELGVQIGKVKQEEDKKSRELMELEVKRQTSETRLADLKAQLEQYAGVPTIDASKAELEELANKSRATMDSMGAVNLRAPELYEEKKRDIEEIKSRVSSLDSEKKAVLSMMDEIEGKKRAIFLSAFTSVNDNFKKLFSYVFPGEGTLILEQPSNPFESGLLVKVREASGRDKYLESMSGGEKSLLALLFIFAIQMHKAAPFYILDEADAALDKENSKKLAELLKQLSKNTQFIVVTHNDTVLSSAEVALGVTSTEDGSKIVGVQLTSSASVARPKRN